MIPIEPDQRFRRKLTSRRSAATRVVLLTSYSGFGQRISGQFDPEYACIDAAPRNASPLEQKEGEHHRNTAPRFLGLCRLEGWLENAIGLKMS